MNSNQTRVALVQMRCGPEPDKNFAHAVDFIHEAAGQGAQITCLPELFRSQYFCQSEDHKNFALAEEIPGQSTLALGDVARETRIVIIASIFEKRSAGVYHNTAAIITDDGKLLGKYRKMHIPDDPLYHEKFYFTPGDLGFHAWDTRYARIGVLVCWDQWYPEAARLTVLHGAQLLFYPTAIGWHPGEKAEYGVSQHSAWETIQRSHAIANGVYVVSVNRVGHEGAPPPDGLEFWGASFVCDPAGNLVKVASHDREEVLVVSCNLDSVDRTRTHWPFLR